jgi:ParB/RepB/Spo0J family partition protein
MLEFPRSLHPSTASSPALSASISARPQSLLYLPVASIKPSPRALRSSFNETALDQLAESIKRWGQLQPVVVQRAEDRFDQYTLVFGERRWLAHQRAGLTMIWALERQVAESERLALALVENLHRVGLSHAEKVAALDQLLEMCRAEGLRQTAHRIRITPGWLSSQLAVRRDPVIFPALENGSLSFGQAAELMRAPAKARPELLERTLRHEGRTTTATIRAWVRQTRAIEQPPSEAGATEAANYARVLEQLRQLPALQSAEDVNALRALVLEARQRLRTHAGRCTTRVSTEITCMMCGEPAGAVVNGKKFEPRACSSVRKVGRRLVCGRCGGSLVPSDRTERYLY